MKTPRERIADIRKSIQCSHGPTAWAVGELCDIVEGMLSEGAPISADNRFEVTAAEIAMGRKPETKGDAIRSFRHRTGVDLINAKFAIERAVSKSHQEMP